MARELSDLLASLLGSQHSWQLTLLQKWEMIVGNLKTRVQLLKIQEDTLILGVPDSCWMQELYLLSPLLIHTINKHLDSPRIKHLRFKATGKPEQKRRRGYQATTTNPQKITLSSVEEKALHALTDPELAHACKEYLARIKE